MRRILERRIPATPLSMMRLVAIHGLILVSLLAAAGPACSRGMTPPGSVVFVVEREAGTLAVVDYRRGKLLKRIKVGGDLRHAAMVFDPDLRYGYLASRSGHLARVDLRTLQSAGRVRTSRNSIGLAVSQDGSVVAVSEYRPGGITLVDTRSFTIMQKIPARIASDGRVSRVTGLVDGAGGSFVCALMDGREIWELRPLPGGPQAAGPSRPRYQVARRIRAAAMNPFDALITPEGRYYLTGHFRSDTVSLVDLWSGSKSARRVYFPPRSPGSSPVKMPHMETWAALGGRIYVPRVGEKRLSIVSTRTFREIDSIPLLGNPVYAVVSPEGREIWVTFSGSEVDGRIQIIDIAANRTSRVLDVGRRIYHLVFTPRGDLAMASSNATNELILIRTRDHKITGRLKLNSPSGIFGVWRGFRLGL